MSKDYLKKWVFPILLFIIAFIAHSSYIANEFTWLDHIDLEEGFGRVPWQEINTVFQHPYSQTTFYRPMITIVHSIDYFLYGLWAPGFHLTNIFIHAIVTVLTYILVRKLNLATPLNGFIATVIVAIHPVNAYSVGLISYRADPLAVALLLGSIIALINYIQHNSKKALLISSVLCVAASLAKETSLIWYPVFAALILYFYNKTRQTRICSLILFLYALTAGLFIILKLSSGVHLWGIAPKQLPLDQAVGTRIESYHTLIRYLLIPVVPPISDAVKVVGISFYHILGTLLIIPFLVTIYKNRNNKKYILLAFLFILSLAPAVNIVPLPRFVSPHYLYFTTVIMSLIFAFILENVRGKSYRISIITMFSVWVFIAAFSTYYEGERFNDDKSLFFLEVQSDKHFREGAYYIGRYEFLHKNYSQAEKYLLQAVTYSPGYLSYVDSQAAKNNLALVMLQMNKFEKAEHYFEEVVRENTGRNRENNIYNLALTKISLNKNIETIVLLEKEIIKNKQGSVEMYIILAQAYSKSGQNDKSEAILNEINPLLKSDAQKEMWLSTKKLLP
ncbi:MAG: hypothetical protein M3Q44_06340 [bacterium]|nr:hypothetical protein [bacterium]